MGQIDKARPMARAPRCRAGVVAAVPVSEREQCLEMLLDAVSDIAERDDIHQAAERLARVQEWIRREAERAANDPLFGTLRLAS